MGWNNYQSEVEGTSLTDSIEDNKLVPKFLGLNQLTINTEYSIGANNSLTPIELTAQKNVNTVGPSFITYDNLYILTKDKKFLNVRREENG